MAGIILDFEGAEFNTIRDLVVFIRECADEKDSTRARAFRDAYREANPDLADTNIADCISRAYRGRAAEVRRGLDLFQVTSAIYGKVSPREATRDVWENAHLGEGLPPTLQELIETGIKDAENLA